MQLITKKQWIRWGSVCVLMGVALLPAMAEEPAIDNAVQMVTYFPVQYVRYNNVFPDTDANNSGKIDIGLVSGENFSLKVVDGNLAARQVNVRNVAGNPTLKMAKDFKTKTAGSTADFGHYVVPQPGVQVSPEIDDVNNAVSFGKLYLKVPNVEGDPYANISANKLEISNTSQIQYFGENKGFPPCQDARWVQLTLSAEKTGYYLVCCTDSESGVCPAAQP